MRLQPGEAALVIGPDGSTRLASDDDSDEQVIYMIAALLRWADQHSDEFAALQLQIQMEALDIEVH